MWVGTNAIEICRLQRQGRMGMEDTSGDLQAWYRLALATWGKPVSSWGRNARTVGSTQVTMVQAGSGAQSSPPSPWVAPFQHRNGKCPAWLPSPPGPPLLLLFPRCRESLVWFKVRGFQKIQRTVSNVSWRPGHVEAWCFTHPSGQRMMRIISC